MKRKDKTGVGDLKEERLEEEEKEEKRRREDVERETRRQEGELRRLEMDADIIRQKEAAEVAKREHELELARLAQGNLDVRLCDREDRAKALKLPRLLMEKMIWTHICRGSRDLRIQLSGKKLDGHQNSVLCCLDEH